MSYYNIQLTLPHAARIRRVGLIVELKPQILCVGGNKGIMSKSTCCCSRCLGRRAQGLQGERKKNKAVLAAVSAGKHCKYCKPAEHSKGHYSGNYVAAYIYGEWQWHFKSTNLDDVCCEQFGQAYTDEELDCCIGCDTCEAWFTGVQVSQTCSLQVTDEWLCEQNAFHSNSILSSLDFYAKSISLWIIISISLTLHQAKDFFQLTEITPNN